MKTDRNRVLTGGRRIRRTVAIAVFAALGIAGWSPVIDSTKPAFAQEVLRTNSRPIMLERNKGRLIRLQEPAGQVFVADPEIADIQIRSPRLVYIFGKAPGETSFIAVGENENVLLNSRVVVNHNISRLRGAMNRILPDNAIQVNSTDGTILLTGQVASPDQAENARRLAIRFAGDEAAVINNLQITGPSQVNLRVRIVEMSRSALRDIGIDWSAVIQQGALVAGIFTGAAAPAIPAGQLRSNFATPSGFSISTVIRLLQQRGMIRVLAEPNLTARSGETAHFLAGGEFPIPVPQDDNVVTIEFKRFGVSLSFTPVVLQGNRLSLRVAPEVSQLSTEGAIQIQGFNVPSLTTRRAETTVDLASGQSLVIAGLLQRSMTGNLSEVPGIGRVPVVGRLFQSERFQRNETELVIIVTPFIVRPNQDRSETASEQTSETRMPHRDPGRLFTGQRNVAAHDQNNNPVELHGPHGFILE